jgi:hypothetical protein
VGIILLFSSDLALINPSLQSIVLNVWLQSKLPTIAHSSLLPPPLHCAPNSAPLRSSTDLTLSRDQWRRRRWRPTLRQAWALPCYAAHPSRACKVSTHPITSSSLPLQQLQIHFLHLLEGECAPSWWMWEDDSHG